MERHLHVHRLETRARPCSRQHCKSLDTHQASFGSLVNLPITLTGGPDQYGQVIYKPSEKSPLGTLALAPLYAAAGFPPGVVQFVTGARETGALLASHMGISKISFTGSVAGGKAVQEAATRSNLKRVTLELGGKSPAVVFKDADFEQAVNK